MPSRNVEKHAEEFNLNVVDNKVMSTGRDGVCLGRLVYDMT